jgi:CheY-like chemotaxis protein
MKNKLKILWIEDEGQQIRGLVRPIVLDGNEVEIADNKNHAIPLLEDKYDAILLDLIIPEGIKRTNNDFSYERYVGVDLLKHIKEGVNKYTPVIVLSVVNDSEVIEKVKKIGVYSVLRKGSLLPTRLRDEVYAATNNENK